MMTVKIYKVTCTKAYRIDEQGTGYSLEPWGKNTMYYEGYDDGGQDYELPEGYEVAKALYDDLQIYDAKGEHVWLGCIKGRPVLYPGDDKIIYLKKSKSEG